MSPQASHEEAWGIVTALPFGNAKGVCLCCLLIWSVSKGCYVSFGGCDKKSKNAKFAPAIYILADQKASSSGFL